MFDDYFSRAYSGHPFALFSASHLTALVAVVASCLLLAQVLRAPAMTDRAREGVRHGLAIFALLNLAAWYTWEWLVGLSSWDFSLPIQVCTASTILCPLMLWSRSYRLFEVVYFWGFAGVPQALLTPDVAPFDFPHFVFIIFFTSHAIVLLCAIFMMVVNGYRPHWRSIVRVVPITVGLLSLAGLANWLTGGNYMFVARKPPFPTLIDYLGPWPWYVLSLLALGVVMFVLVYLPFAIRDWMGAFQGQRRASHG